MGETVNQAELPMAVDTLAAVALAEARHAAFAALDEIDKTIARVRRVKGQRYRRAKEKMEAVC